MRVSWTPPDYDGGTPIIGYLIEYKNVSQTPKWTKVNVAASGDCTAVLQSLEENTKYQFRVYAENEVGWSAASHTTDVNITLGMEYRCNFTICIFFFKLNKALSLKLLLSIF